MNEYRDLCEPKLQSREVLLLQAVYLIVNPRAVFKMSILHYRF